MSLDTSNSNLTEISKSTDTLHVRNYLSSPDTNKNQAYIDNKTAPNFHQPCHNQPPPSNPNHHHDGS